MTSIDGILGDGSRTAHPMHSNDILALLLNWNDWSFVRPTVSPEQHQLICTRLEGRSQSVAVMKPKPRFV